MTHEQLNAFNDWWNKSSIGCDKGAVCRDAFASGWEAAVNRPAKVTKISELPIVDTASASKFEKGWEQEQGMPDESKFEQWWEHGGAKDVTSESTARWVWRAAWATAKLGQLDRAKEEVEAEMRANLMALAVQFFREKDTARAEFYRDLADERHIIWSK